MTHFKLSNMVLEQIVPRIQAVAKHGPGADRWANELAYVAQIKHDEEDETAISDALDAWISDVSPDTLARSLNALASADSRTCDARLVAAMIELGANPYALYVLSAVSDGPVTADYGTFKNGQICLLPGKGDHDELMIPLTSEVYWAGDRLLVRSELPDTVLNALVGRSARAIAEHRLIPDVRVTGIGENQGSYRSIEIEPGAHVAWTETLIQ